LVITTDQDFQQRLRSLSTSVDQVLVPFPSFDALGRSDVLNDYPDLYRGGEPWAELVREFPGPIGWRLYRIKRP
ncbi:MAG: hypothetical protein HY235_27000, partial [Acidobacteria bacterium]|nr:hypothetical protein [Acidobacteriota bacterium]